MQEKSHKLKNVLFGKSVKKLKNISPLTTTFYNFALKMETSWAKRVPKPILETWNAPNDVIVYVWFINYLTRNYKNMQCKKEKSKCTKFKIKS